MDYADTLENDPLINAGKASGPTLVARNASRDRDKAVFGFGKSLFSVCSSLLNHVLKQRRQCIHQQGCNEQNAGRQQK